MASNVPTQEVATIEATATKVAVKPLDPKVLAIFAERATAIPLQEDSGQSDILLQIFSAKTWQEVDKPWQTSEVKDLEGLTLRVTYVRRLPSRFKDGLGLFLVVKMTDVRSGKEYVKATGAISVVGQFVQLYFMGVTAVTIKWHQAEYPTDDGYFPQHLEIVDAATPDSNGDQ